MPKTSTPLPQRLVHGAALIAQLALVGLLVGLACWPLNLIDHWQDLLLQRLPLFSGTSWGAQQLLL
ncbi:MAG: hypothetical protein FJ057_01415, partial [Cyanobacteria bacterium K_DeepCast_0m_m1_088]|nr:hypothetical protein [Cyanobacteria bacterium K_DeepCast_0m_m1_088]